MKIPLLSASDRVFFSAAAIAALGMAALAMVWPQADGKRSPAPFGHPTTVEVAAAAAKSGEARPNDSAQKSHLKGPF